MDAEWRVYSAETAVREPGAVIRSMFRGVADSRYAGYRLALKDIRTTYTKSVFGMTWDLVDPLVLGAVFYFLRRSDIINVGELPVPYSLFVICGLLLFSTFRDSLLASLELLRQSKGLLSQLKLPPEALILSVLYRMLFDSIFRIAVIAFFSIILGRFSVGGFLAFLVLYSTLILAGASLGLLLSPFHVIYNDVGRVTRIILTPFRYVSPVLWPIPSVGMFYWLNLFNPIGPLINDLRLLVTSGQMQEPIGFFVRAVLYGIVFLVAWYIFRVAIPVLVDRA